MAVVLVTGCSSGIGHGLCLELIKHGCKVAESLEELKKEGLNVLSIDVTRAETIMPAVDAVMAKEGRIDILINNAGVNCYGPIIEMDLADVRNVFETNVIGLVAVTQIFSATLQMKQREGKIINIGSSVGVFGTAFAGPYCGSKAAVEMISQSMRVELEPFGVQPLKIIADNGSRGIEKYKNGAWGPIYASILKRANAAQDLGTPTALFSAGVAKEVLKGRMRFEYWSGKGSSVFRFLGHIPTWITIWLFRRRWGLDVLAKIIRGK